MLAYYYIPIFILLARPRKISEGKIGGITTSPLTPNNTNAMRNGGRSRSTVAHSQPGSRSTSPSSISSYATYFSQSGQPTSVSIIIINSAYSAFFRKLFIAF